MGIASAIDGSTAAGNFRRGSTADETPINHRVTTTTPTAIMSTYMGERKSEYRCELSSDPPPPVWANASSGTTSAVAASRAAYGRWRSDHARPTSASPTVRYRTAPPPNARYLPKMVARLAGLSTRGVFTPAITGSLSDNARNRARINI